MKIQSVVFLTVVLIITTLVADTVCFKGKEPPKRKREYQEKVWKCLFINLMLVKVSSKSCAKT